LQALLTLLSFPNRPTQKKNNQNKREKNTVMISLVHLNVYTGLIRSKRNWPLRSKD